LEKVIRESDVKKLKKSEENRNNDELLKRIKSLEDENEKLKKQIDELQQKLKELELNINQLIYSFCDALNKLKKPAFYQEKPVNTKLYQIVTINYTDYYVVSLQLCEELKWVKQ